ncbi:MAG: ATP-binding protein [Erysipelotrichaceae bacterium]|nr:ATP-binding protein [Erysipelotrichaceae bacterium]
MFRSIRWKFTTIYFMLVFIGMIIAGVTIVSSFEQFQLKDVSRRLLSLSELIKPQIERYENLGLNSSEIRTIIQNQSELGFREEIFVVDGLDYKIAATSTQNIGRSAESLLDFELLVEGFNGQSGEKRIVIDENGYQIRTMDRVEPIRDNTQTVVGLLYIRYDLTDVYNNLSESKQTIVRATLLALGVTILLGFIIARTITEPINDVTEKAAKMAAGDFDQRVDVKSNDEIGKLAIMFNVLTSELKTSMDEISREKSKLEAIIHYMDDGLIAVDRDGDIIHLNPKAVEMFSISPDVEKIDQIFRDIDEDLIIKNIVRNSSKWIGSKIVDHHGSTIKVNFAPFENVSGVKSGFVFVLQDITEQEKLDRMRRDFVANVSHELKTPLTSIKSYTETLLDGGVDDRETMNEFLGVINGEADRMARLVRDLLQLSNFDAKTAHLDLQAHDMLHLVRQCIKKLENSAKAKHMTIKINTQESTLVTNFDYDRMEQVMINVLGNAIKYTQEEGKVTIFASKLHDEVILRVCDNGMGIPDKDLSRIFERFYRVDKARSRAHGGTGLGLSIARQFVEAHGGTIGIESTLDIGTTVTIRLPMGELKMS